MVCEIFLKVDPNTAHIACLHAKLIESFQKQCELTVSVEDKAETIHLLREELFKLQNLVKQKDEDHADALRRKVDAAHKIGHSEAVSEIKSVWKSKEFASEMMYGMNYFCMPCLSC